MIAALAFPIYMSIPVLNKGMVDHTLVYVGIGILLLVVYTHRKNVSRLMNGEENKTYLFKSRDRD
jgi:glycerol-3-phosphate acyltransferase PlsY